MVVVFSLFLVVGFVGVCFAWMSIDFGGRNSRVWHALGF